MSKIVIGTIVEWKTHRHFANYAKRGMVVEVVPAGVFPVFAVDRGTAIPRSHESYVVKVPTGVEGRGKGKLYWPRVSSDDEGYSKHPVFAAKQRQYGLVKP